MADWLSSITDLGKSGASVYNVVKSGQNVHDQLNQESGIEARRFEYGIMSTQQKTAAAIKIMLVAALVIVVIVVVMARSRK